MSTRQALCLSCAVALRGMRKIWVLGLVLAVFAAAPCFGENIVDGGNSTGADITVGTNDSYKLHLESGGSARVTVDTAGNVGIGTTAPGSKLHVDGGIIKVGTARGSQGELTSNTVKAGATNAWLNLAGGAGNAYIAIGDSAIELKMNYLRYKSGSYGGALDVSAGVGSVITFGTDTDLDAYLKFGAYSNVNNLDTKARDLRIFSTADSTGLTYKQDTGKFGIGTTNPGGLLEVSHNGTSHDLVVDSSSGNVGIGTASPQSALAVNGTITAKEIKVRITGWPDYVFDDDYRLLSLEDTERYVRKNKHLPGVPSAKEVEKNGLAVSEMMQKHMAKIEELTLHMIKLNKINQDLAATNKLLADRLERLEEKMVESAGLQEEK